MSHDEVIAAVCELPRAFHRCGRSMLSLLQETGLDRDPAVLTESEVAQYLAEHPESVQAWLLRSNNQRVERPIKTWRPPHDEVAITELERKRILAGSCVPDAVFRQTLSM